jgi:GntR family transcriptional regulator
LSEQQQTGLPEGGKARRVYLLLRDEMASGALADGAAIPAEQKLAEMHGVSRVTVRRALDALAADGLIEKRAGAGSFVRPRAQSAAPITGDMASLMSQLVEMGRTTTARLISFAYGPAPSSVASALKLSRGGKVQTATRVRYSARAVFPPHHLCSRGHRADLRRGRSRDAAAVPLLERSGVHGGPRPSDASAPRSRCPMWPKRSASRGLGAPVRAERGARRVRARGRISFGALPPGHVPAGDGADAGRRRKTRAIGSPSSGPD